MQKANKKETLELYRDHNTQMFLSKFLSGEIKTLEPVYDQQTGYRYPAVEAIVGDASQVEPFLSKLYGAGVLEKKLYDKIIFCPKCGSANVSFRYCCPFCKSFDIQKSSLIEHVKCGYMDIETNFSEGDKYVCPKCHEELRKIDVDYRKAGVWCKCGDCNKSFDIPVPEHFCRSCHANSTFEEALIKDVYSYTLQESAREEFSLSWFLVAPIRDFLIEEGLTVESPAFLKGKSGANHSFDIVAYKGGELQKVIVVDLAKSTENGVSEQPVIALFAKIFDVSPERAFLIAIPKLSENGKKMAELYNIQAIEAKNQKEAIKALKAKFLERTISQSK
jgi:transcription elongation factor Elf1